MKRTVFLLIFTMIATTVVHAQGRDIRRANRQLDRGNLADALQHLEDAQEHESVFDDPEFWLTKSRLYMEFAVTQEEAYKNLVENPVDKADEALFKAKELDTGNQFILEIQPMLLFLSDLTFNVGAEAYESDNWLKASDYFLRSYEVGLSYDDQDTLKYSYAGISAELGGNFERAKKIYLELRDMEYDESYIYSSLSNIAMEQGDTLLATEFIQEGREKYPEELDLIFAEANIHIFTGNINNAREILDLAIQKDPENPHLYFAFGANYDRMSQDTTYTVEERQFAFNEAIKAYESAIELRPDYFDAVYNLGVLYFNRGIRIFEQAEERLRETHDFARYEEDEKEFKHAWLEAQPYLEEAKAMLEMDDPNMEIVVISLVELYARTDQPEKLEEILPLYRKYYAEEEEEME